ncbi:hypothetical protein V1512DRAFT_260502 [Lipomyces arxii]|uniref:uncharacterized protein n=1 Tax=Lipomyces arxii TaxID=56418 RepID=UPI0034CFB998
MPDLVTYARQHHIATNFLLLRYERLLSELPPVHNFLPSKCFNPVYIPDDELAESDEFLRHVVSLFNNPNNQKEEWDRVQLDERFDLRQCLMEQPEVRSEVPTYLSRVAPFAYMGTMAIDYCENFSTEWMMKQLDLREKLQVKADVLAFLTETTKERTVNTNKVFLFPALKLARNKMSSPLLPETPEKELFEPKSGFESLADSVSPKWSLDEPFTSFTSEIQFATPSTSSSKRVRPTHFSSPLLRVSKQPRLPDMLSNVKLEEARPTAYSQTVDRVDRRMTAQMQKFKTFAVQDAETEQLVKSDLDLRIAIPTVDPLEKSADRAEKIAKLFPANLKDVKNHVHEWRRSTVESTLRWRPFMVGKDEYLDPGDALPGVYEPIVTVVSDPEWNRSRSGDWELDDAESSLEEGDAVLQTSQVPPTEPLIASLSVKSLDDLIALRKATAFQSFIDEADDEPIPAPLMPFHLSGLMTGGNDEPEHEAETDNDVSRDEQAMQRNIDTATGKKKSLQDFGVMDFASGTTVIVNTTFLTSCSGLYRDLANCTTGIKFVERDYGAEEADVQLSSSCGVISFLFPQIMQIGPDGTNFAAARANKIWQKTETVLVLVRVVPELHLKSRSDFDALARFVRDTVGCRVCVVCDRGAELVAWFAKVVRLYAGRGVGVAEVETTWERFLREVGVNGYAAQEILKKYKLPVFIKLGHQTRLAELRQSVGPRVLNTVTKVLEAPLSL